ncbi:SDR family oxidoreductase [Rhizosphaericola mali]|uniref:SDR family oxidoreductase n=1 Tax=Rhizosphaericola mali TaxID=2545455 RepID=A0A5P2G9Z0_9BACT|nr:SDR family oxidoreductase [Rhizosphaericola mali]QES88351.1 SDR family oxidoreductase [Rhizosphaericola mali]
MAKTIFITGASTGIGKITAKLFQSKGWNVIATLRDPSKETELTQLANVTVLPLDVKNTTQIQSIVDKVTSSVNIDVVVNNAGFGIVGPFEGTPENEIERIVNTNILGVMRVTKAFLPHFRSQKNGVLITVSSEGGLITYPFFALYHATKWAIEGWTESMVYELKPLGIQIKTVLPGPTKTEFGNSIFQSSHSAYENTFDKFRSSFLSEKARSTFQSADVVANSIYEAATDGKYQIRYLSGETARKHFSDQIELGTEEFHNKMEKSLL